MFIFLKIKVKFLEIFENTKQTIRFRKLFHCEKGMFLEYSKHI